jgi:hypothetical protein
MTSPEILLNGLIRWGVRLAKGDEHTFGLIDPRNSASHDFPPPGGPVRAYVIAATQRSGSTLLCRTLWDSGIAGAPKEYLNPLQLRDWEVRFGTPRSQLLYLVLRGRLLHRQLNPSVDTSKPASRGHLKSGQLAGLRDECSLSCLLGSGQLKSFFGAPAPWSEFDDMRVVEEAVEHGRYGC